MPKVLIIDDDPDQLLMYRVEFEGHGFEVATIESGEGALKAAVAEKPNVILLDIHMEDRSGLDVLSELKQFDDTKNIPVVIFTNFSKQQFAEAAKEIGASKFIVKTERLPREIVKDVEEVLGNSESDISKTKERKEKVLLVEDNPYHREMYTTKFFLAGFRLITAANGEKALEEVNNNKIDLILLDLALPGMSGLDVLKQLKADEVTKNIPVVTFTVTPKSELPRETREYLEDHTVAYFEKMTQLPNEAVELVEKILAHK